MNALPTPFPPCYRRFVSALLPGLGILVAALLILGLLAFLTGIRPKFGISAFTGGGALMALVFLAVGAPPATVTLPIGPPGAALTLAIDGLSGFFLLLLFISAAAASLAEAEFAPFLPVFIAAMALTLLAGDAFTLVLGFELMSVASFFLVAPGDRDAALLYIGMAALGAMCLIPALALLSNGGLTFAALRAHPPEGLKAALVLGLTLIGAGSKAGLFPLHVWLPPAHAAAPAPVSALMSGAMTKVAVYVVIRIVFDLCGPAPPAWWGAPLMLLGAALGALRANMEQDVKAILACSTVENIGLIFVGLGLALVARAADLGALAALAMGGALLHAMAHALFKSLLFLASGAVLAKAGTRRLDRLGGLIHLMPRTTICVLAAGASLAGLPPTSGFAGEWMLFQSLMGAPRIGGLGLQVLVCVITAAIAMAIALGAAATVRLIGVGFLGRPRTPRTAGAEDPAGETMAALIGLAGLTALIGLFPNAVLRLAAPALRPLAGALPITYGALPTAFLLLIGGCVIVVLVRRYSPTGHREAPAWDCGFGAPPPWLPFGDPLTQYAPAGFAQPLRRALGTALLNAHEQVDMPEPGMTRAATINAGQSDPAERHLFNPVAALRDRVSGLADRMQFLTVRQTLSVMFGALILFLVAIAALEQL